MKTMWFMTTSVDHKGKGCNIYVTALFFPSQAKHGSEEAGLIWQQSTCFSLWSEMMLRIVRLPGTLWRWRALMPLMQWKLFKRLSDWIYLIKQTPEGMWGIVLIVVEWVSLNACNKVGIFNCHLPPQRHTWNSCDWSHVMISAAPLWSYN